MAQRIIVQKIDDLTGEEIDTETASEITFALDGIEYKIDLTIENAKKLRNGLEPYIAVARRSGGRRIKNTLAETSTTPNFTQEVRAWAQKNGYTVSDRGRIPFPIQEAFRNR